MIVCAAGVMFGLLLGALRGGSLRTLRSVRLRFLTAAGMGMLVLGMHQVGLLDAGSAIAVAGLLAIAVVAGANLHLAGLGLVAIGVCLNAVPLAINGGTPVDLRALGAIGVEPDVAPRYVLESQHVADDTTTLAVLGSTIPVPGIDRVVSFGDLIIAMGLAAAVANAMRRPRPRSGIPVSEILASGPLTLGDDVIDLTDGATQSSAPAVVPSGWELSEH